MTNRSETSGLRASSGYRPSPLTAHDHRDALGVAEQHHTGDREPLEHTDPGPAAQLSARARLGLRPARLGLRIVLGLAGVLRAGGQGEHAGDREPPADDARQERHQHHDHVHPCASSSSRASTGRTAHSSSHSAAASRWLTACWLTPSRPAISSCVPRPLGGPPRVHRGPAALGAAQGDRRDQGQHRLGLGRPLRVTALDGDRDRALAALGALHGAAGQHERRPGPGARLGRQRLVDRTGPDAHAPATRAQHRQGELDDRGGVGQDSLDLVTDGPLEPAQHRSSARELGQQRGHPIDVAPAASLVDRQDEHKTRLATCRSWHKGLGLCLQRRAVAPSAHGTEPTCRYQGRRPGGAVSNEYPMPAPVPPGAPRSPDGAWWWDGHTWRPAAATGYPTRRPRRRAGEACPAGPSPSSWSASWLLLVPILAAVAIPVYLNQRDAAEHAPGPGGPRPGGTGRDRARRRRPAPTAPTRRSSSPTSPRTSRRRSPSCGPTRTAGARREPSSGAEPIAWYSSTYGLSDQPCG